MEPKPINVRRMSDRRLAELARSIIVHGFMKPPSWAEPVPPTEGVKAGGAADTCICSGCSRRRLRIPDERLPSMSATFGELIRRFERK